MGTYKKKYKKALERAREWYNNSNSSSIGKSYLYAVFPELAESEDERIRKELLVWLKSRDGQTLPIDRYNAALAWLEKQGKTFTKKDVDDAYLKGISDAKNELEKQVEQKPAWSEEDEKNVSRNY